MNTESLVITDSARPCRAIPPLPATAPRALGVALARSRAEIRAAQRLRYAIFAGEMGARLHNRLPGLDHDRLDGYCQHLIVRDAVGQVVGCTRLLTAEAARRAGGVSTRPLVWWSRGLCRILDVRLQSRGTPHAGAALFVANHISWLDIFCIAAVCPTQFLAKQEVAAWPLFGWLCRRAGTAFIRRGGDNGAGEATERLVWRLRQGERVKHRRTGVRLSEPGP